MFVLLDVGATGLDGQEFASRLFEERHVSVVPGTSFGNVGKNFVRVT